MPPFKNMAVHNLTSTQKIQSLTSDIDDKLKELENRITIIENNLNKILKILEKNND